MDDLYANWVGLTGSALLTCELRDVPRRFRERRFELRGRRRELIATVGELALVQTARRGGERTVLWTVTYARITSYWGVYRPGGENAPSTRRVSLVVAGERLDFSVLSRDGKALLGLLDQRVSGAARVRGLGKYRLGDYVSGAVSLAIVTAALVIAIAGLLRLPSTPAATPSGIDTSSLIGPPAASVTAGECFDALAQPTACGSDVALLAATPCATVTRFERQVLSLLTLPEITKLKSVASDQGLCLRPSASLRRPSQS
jgi:hypothetical protein